MLERIYVGDRFKKKSRQYNGSTTTLLQPAVTLQLVKSWCSWQVVYVGDEFEFLNVVDQNG